MELVHGEIVDLRLKILDLVDELKMTAEMEHDFFSISNLQSSFFNR
jgi:hypothetical protein